ncbi:MAG: TetR/AcrR family transcriptional regulator [Clostridium sp.]|nr:TetR/AcrR family transcriptional regulator [Clostridium sp.]
MKKEKREIFSDFKQSVNESQNIPNSRRRGEVLENDILQAVWDELAEVGYTHLTMEGVAARAKTNKPSIYRRWPKKSELVIASLRKHLSERDIVIPNTGSLRSDLLNLLYNITKTMKGIGAETLHGLMADNFGKEMYMSLPLKIDAISDESDTIMMTILTNAEARGEIDLKKIKKQVISLPMDLIRYEFLTTHETISDEKVTEIVDDIFLPLVRTSL